MNCHGKFRKRKSTRLKSYDYSLPGAYFVTIVTQDRLCLFGHVVGGVVGLTQAGVMVQHTWEELSNRFQSICFDAFVVMPNHIHGIVIAQKPVGAPLVGARPPDSKQMSEDRDVTKIATPRLGDVVGAYKSITTIKYVRGVEAHGWRRFPRRLWQRNYFERVIRDEQEMTRAREYIVNNPKGWKSDPENVNGRQPWRGIIEESLDSKVLAERPQQRATTRVAPTGGGRRVE